MSTFEANYEEASTPHLQERIAKATKDQDAQVDALYEGVKRLKNTAIAANDEVVTQNAMIDDISVQINHTESAVQQQAVAAKKVVSKHRELCCYYIIIILLTVGLIVILVI